MRLRCSNRAIARVGGLAFLTTALSLTLTACAGSSDDEDGNLANNSQAANADMGGDDAAEGNGQENYVDAGKDPKDGGGAGINSDTGASPPPDAGANPASPDALAAELPPTNAPPANAQPAPAPDAKAAAPAPAAAAGGPQAPVQGGRVRYVKAGGAQAVNAPNGSPVMTLDQGEHPVTWSENGWLKVAEGVYLPAEAMSDRGVTRIKGPRSWGH